MFSTDYIEKFHNTLKEHSSYDLSGYSEKSLMRRLSKIISEQNITKEQLLRKITESEPYCDSLVQEITVNTTELFRDPQIWQTIKFRILKKLKYKSTINIWHAGSSTGQEVYSMLILLNELNLLHKANIYATDINQKVIDTAISGKYPYRFNIEYIENFMQVVQKNPYNFEEFYDTPFSKYFDVDKSADLITAKDFIRNRAIYKQHDLVKPGNVFDIKFDIILCRNVLIYFRTQLQNQLFNLFAENLVSKGFLILGAHESILGKESRHFIKHGHFYIKK